MPDDDEEQVGYGRPPKKTRFTKGRSGNPSGRPKRVVMAISTFEEQLARMVPVKLNGTTRRMPLKEALEMKIVEGSIALPPPALLKMYRELLQEVTRSREAEARLNAQKANKIVQECIDSKEIVDALIALGLVQLTGDVRRIVPELLYRLATREALEADVRPEIINLRRYYWPGTRPNRPQNDDEEAQVA